MSGFFPSQGSVQWPHSPFTTTTSRWNPQIYPSSSEVGHSPEAFEGQNYGGETDHHLQDQDLSPTQSRSTTDQSQQEVSAIEYNYPHEQYFVSASAQGRSCNKHVEGQVNPVVVSSHPCFRIGQSQAEIDPSMPEVMGLPPERVLLPIGPEDKSLVYVSAKRFNAIVRRRQKRKQDEEKVLKSRKGYIHESRHRHAVNRARGTGGRFLSKSEQANPAQPSSHNLAFMSVDNSNDSSFNYP